MSDARPFAEQPPTNNDPLLYAEEVSKIGLCVLTHFRVLINGMNAGLEWRTVIEVPPDNTLYPTVSAERAQKLKMNFGYSPFR